MKVFLVVLALVAAVTAEEWNPKKFSEIKAIRAECLASHPLSAENIDKMKTYVYADEEPVRKYLLCCWEKIDVFCQHEGFHVDRIVKQFKLAFDEAEATAIVESCVDKNEQKTSADAWVYRVHKCLLASKLGDGIKDFVKKAYEAAAQAKSA